MTIRITSLYERSYDVRAMTTTAPSHDRNALAEAAALRERLSRLSAASRRINESLDLDAVLQGVLDSARSLAGARYGVLAVMDDAGQVEALLGLGPGARRVPGTAGDPRRGGHLPALAQAGGTAAHGIGHRSRHRVRNCR